MREAGATGRLFCNANKHMMATGSIQPTFAHARNALHRVAAEQNLKKPLHRLRSAKRNNGRKINTDERNRGTIARITIAK
jgi:hypothetical protein